MKSFKYLLSAALLCGSMLGFQSCDDESYDVVGNPNNLVYFNQKGTDGQANFYSFTVDWTSVGAVGDLVTLKVPVKTTRPADANLLISAGVDNGLVETYNQEHGTAYAALPDNTVEFIKQSVTVPAGATISADSIEFTIPAKNYIPLTERLYLLPVTISSVNGNGVPSTQAGVIWISISLNLPGDKKTDASISNLAYWGTYKMDTQEFPSVYTFTISSESAVQQDETVSLVKDLDLVDTYNQKYNTSYTPLPDNADISIEGLDTKIEVAKTESTPVVVTLNSLDNLVEGTTYMLPITMKEVSIGLNIKEGYNTTFIIIDYKKAGSGGEGDYIPDDPSGKFVALDLTNPNMYANYYFDSDLQKELSTFTYQIKIKANSLPNGHISRFFAFNGNNTVMMRFGEGGIGNRLQFVLGGDAGNHFANKMFLTNTWYLLTIVYDGSKFTMYVDGEKDIEVNYTGYSTLFRGVEIGMSWAGYRENQKFDGSIAEARIWERALNVEEIKGGLNSVDPESPGLMAYWKLNEGEGYIFHDATGNGYTIDWSDTWRCLTETEPDPGTHLTDTHTYVQWDKSEENVWAK